MIYFSRIDKSGIVQQVIAADQAFIDSGAVGDINSWKQVPDNNSAAIGYAYDAQKNAFISPKPFFSWSLNKNTYQWEPPTPMPLDGKMYSWDEKTKNWVKQ